MEDDNRIGFAPKHPPGKAQISENVELRLQNLERAVERVEALMARIDWLEDKLSILLDPTDNHEAVQTTSGKQSLTRS